MLLRNNNEKYKRVSNDGIFIPEKAQTLEKVIIKNLAQFLMKYIFNSKSYLLVWTIV